MTRVVFVFLSALALILDQATAFNNNNNATTNLEAAPDNGETIISLSNYAKNNAFKQRINLIPLSPLKITVTDVPSDIWFIILQIHTFQYNATISYDKTLLDKVSSGSVFGSNIGLYLKTHDITTPTQAFLKHNNVHNLDALLVIVGYDRNAPIPGGCNMEFDIEVAPYQKLHTGNEMIIVDAQPASTLADNESARCEKNPVQHKMYRLYLPRRDFTPDTYFEMIASMLTTQDILRNGDEIPAGITSPMKRIYSAYTGTGSIYVAIATYGDNSSAYIPIFTYGCSPLVYPESCQVLNGPFAKIICAFVLIIGILSILIGHKYPSLGHVISSCTMGGILGYTLAVAISDYSTATNILIGSASAILAIILSTALRSCERCTFLQTLPLGFLCACITYLYAPAYMFYVLETDWLFWPMFVSLMLVIAMFLAKMPYIAEIITRVVFGSYFLIVAIDYYAGSNLKYIILTLIRRVTISEFRLAFVYPPYQSADVTLTIIWAVLITAQFIIGFVKLCNEPSPMTGFSENTVTTSLLFPHRLTNSDNPRMYQYLHPRYRHNTT
ncbi:transmembrane 7 superfamily member 3-like [Nylanderia fulva]|uniref:transmembrane 7 superfamily member 3-like n=1 Tax=Nylanderia fulva TaxID=613905 RepID=UPI0010FB6F19|nr:transmembrane 7 superfamily member 3-like [Nylanderia fulva]